MHAPSGDIGVHTFPNNGQSFGISTILFKEKCQMNIIEEMYNGNLFPVSTYAHSSEEYRKHVSIKRTQ
jgi:hypothetical protein